MSAATSNASRARSLYRQLLRELPTRKPSLLANPSPLHQRIRSQFLPSSNASGAVEPSANTMKNAADATAEFVQYLKAQRTYTTLLERYNPGMNMLEEDRVRLTARRVGMDLPPEWVPGQGNK